MTRDEFMSKAKMEIRRAIQANENRLMGLVEQAWAEGKRNAETETVTQALADALAKLIREKNPNDNPQMVFKGWRTDSDPIKPVEPIEGHEFQNCPVIVYPTWIEYFLELGLSEREGSDGYRLCIENFNKPVPTDIAVKLGIEPIKGNPDAMKVKYEKL